MFSSVVHERTEQRVKRIAAALLVCAIGLGGVVAGAPASADPTPPSEEDIDDAREAENEAEAAAAAAQKKLDAVKEKLDELHIQTGKAVEAYNGARLAAEKAEKAQRKADKRATKAEAAAADARSTLARLASASYQNGGELATLGMILDADDELAFYDGVKAFTNVIDANAQSYERARAAVADAEDAAAAAAEAAETTRTAADEAGAAREAAEQMLADQEDQVAAMEEEREAALQELADAHGTTAELERERQEYLEEQERLAREREAREEAEQRSPSPTPTPEPEPEPAPEPEPEPEPAPSGAAAAVDYAEAQLGKPYEWSADGPDSFDCSGLTMRAWEAGGVSLPHYSVYQAEQTSRVAYSDLAPGDLAFWSDNGAPSGVYHVGLYIGNDKMIHAPRTGENVQVEGIFYWKTPSFYGRVSTS